MGDDELALHVAYQCFPSTALQEQRPADYPMVREVRPAATTKTLEVATQDGRTPEARTGRPRVISILGYDLRPRSVGTDGNYDRLADSLAERGVLEAALSSEDLQRYGAQVQYWTENGWSSKPTFASGNGNQLELAG